jgi:hypothetical protein
MYFTALSLMAANPVCIKFDPASPQAALTQRATGGVISDKTPQ